MKKMMTLLLLLGPFSASAAKYAGEFLSDGVGGRAMGMGGAFVAMSGEASLSYWNPAGLAGLNLRELALMHAERFGNLVNNDYAAYARPLDKTGRSVMAISLIRLSVDDIPFTEDLELVEPNPATRNGQLDAPNEYVLYDDDKIVWESDAETALFLSYGRTVNSRLALGASVKLVRKAVGKYNANGFGFDLGAQYKLAETLTLGANLQDATTTLLLWNQDGARESINPTLKTGLAWVRPLNTLQGHIAVAFDTDIRFEGRDKVGNQISAGAVSFDTHFGIEYFYRNALAFRLGPSAGDLTAGAGIVISKLRFDYAFIGHNDLGDTHRISGALRF